MTIRHVVTAFVLAMCTLAAVLSNSAQADNIGGTCVPDSATVRAGVYETAGFGIRFAGNATGKIRLLCLLEDTDLAGEELEPVIWLSVIDQDGMEAGARVRAHFRRAAYGTNAWIAMGTCDSNTSSVTVPHRLSCPIPAYKFRGDEWYWWDVEIERTNSRVNVEFLGVGLAYFAG
jgi:hypothetical protein